MSKYYIYHDPKHCIGCFSCEAHCKMKNNLPMGPRLCQIIPVGPKRVNNLPRMANIFMPCFHCDNPWCVAACPTGAIQKRAEDGIVSINESLCVGCKSCITACPWGTPQWNPETGKAVKCDYCVDRLDQGLEPACVAKCVTKCLHFGEPSLKAKKVRERFAKAIAEL
ncbi:MAG: 4Fe-4S dicluster domain-containing protein [Desulfobacteraceae bacterium]